MKFGLEVQVIENIVSVLEQHPKVDKAFVFGSRAKGNYRPDSDIDIAIKGNQITTDDIIAISVAIETKGITHKFDLIDYNSIKEPALKDHIDRVGIEFYSRWKEYKIVEIISLEYGKSLLNYRNNYGKYDVFGTNGKIGTSNEFLYSEPSLIIGRKGAYREVHYSKNPFFVIDTAFYTKNKLSDLNTLFLYYWFKNIDINEMDSGSAIPSTSRDEVYDISIKLPPIQEQTAIASILSSLDDKIDLLHHQNKTLEQLAETLFRQWFVEEAEDSWEREPLGKYVTIKRGGSPRPIHDYISETGLNWLKISDVTGVDSPFIFEIKEKIKEEGLSKTTFLKKGSLILSNSATPGIPKILDVDSCIHDGWLHFPKSKFSKEFLYLFFKHIKPELLQLGNGSIFTNLKTDILKEYVLAIPDKKALDIFDEQVKTIFKKLYSNTTQIRTLTQTRDTLLPKLMSGEVRVEM